MYGLSSLALLASIASTAVAQLNTTVEYRLKSDLKANQTNGVLYQDLYLTSYHTGAGLGDATFVRNASVASAGFLNATNTSTAEAPDYVQEFDLGTEFPWTMLLAISDTAYSGWQPVRIDAGAGSSSRGLGEGFFINSTGLQWSSAPGANASLDSFGGWIMCDWWHGVPQLFVRLAFYDLELPSNCADIYLRPEYI